MARPNNRFEVLASAAAERLERARAVDRQIPLLPADPAERAEAPTPAKARRGRGQSQLRRWLDAQGYRQPEEVLAEAAGLASEHDAFATAMMRTEQVLAFSGADAGGTPSQRLALFMQVFAAQIRAAEAVLPYVAGKVDKPPAPVQAVQVVLGHEAGAGDAGGATIEGQARPVPGGYAPPPMPEESKQNQEDSE